MRMIINNSMRMITIKHLTIIPILNTMNTVNKRQDCLRPLCSDSPYSVKGRREQLIPPNYTATVPILSKQLIPPNCTVTVLTLNNFFISPIGKKFIPCKKCSMKTVTYGTPTFWENFKYF